MMMMLIRCKFWWYGNPTFPHSCQRWARQSSAGGWSQTASGCFAPDNGLSTSTSSSSSSSSSPSSSPSSWWCSIPSYWRTCASSEILSVSVSRNCPTPEHNEDKNPPELNDGIKWWQWNWKRKKKHDFDEDSCAETSAVDVVEEDGRKRRRMSHLWKRNLILVVFSKPWSQISSLFKTVKSPSTWIK